MTQPPTTERPVVQRPYRRLSPLTPVARSFIFFAAVMASTWDDLLRGELGPLGWLLLGLLVLGAIYGAASWLRTKYWIEADELRVDTGLISRQSRRIRIDRLQGIDIVQPLGARVFGLAELRMDVAGGSAREGSLAFLRLSDARALKDLLLARRDAVRAERTERAESAERAEGAEPVPGGPPAAPFSRESPSSAPPSAPSSALSSAPSSAPSAPTSPSSLPSSVPAPGQHAARQPLPAPERVLARLDLGTLVASVLLSPETVWLVVLALGFGVGFLLTGHWAGFSATVPVLGGIVLVQFRKLVGNYGFTVTEGPAGMQVRRGLFELNSQTIALPRLQGVVITEPVLWRLLGWARLDVSIAGYSSGDDQRGPAASTVLPVGDRALVLALARHVLDGDDPDAVPLVRTPRTARWVAPVGWRFMAAGADADLVLSREGWLTRRTHVVPHARVQSLRLSQGPWQRRLGLADVHVDSPPGPVNVRARHRYAGEARSILEEERAVSREARRRRR